MSKKSFKKLWKYYQKLSIRDFDKAVRIFQRYVFIRFKQKCEIFQKNISQRNRKEKKKRSFEFIT